MSGLTNFNGILDDCSFTIHFVYQCDTVGREHSCNENLELLVDHLNLFSGLPFFVCSQRVLIFQSYLSMVN